MMRSGPGAPGPETARPLHVYNGGFLLQRRVRRILTLAGFTPRLGWPKAGDAVGVWGASATAHRGEAVAARTGSHVVRVEDAWLRGLFPSRVRSSPPLGLLIDRRGLHFDPGQPSDLEVLMATHPLDDTALLDRARGGIARMIEAGLTKYTACDPDVAAPRPGYVLVLDQVQGDAAVRASGADRNRFREMLYWAQENHPGARILIKPHPEAAGGRPGHFGADDLNPRVALCAGDISPWALFEGAVAVYTVASQMGFEAILAGHRPYVFGQPFYAGWGLTEDAFPVQRRQRRLTRAQLFAAAMLLYPVWYDPFANRLGRYEDAAEALAADTRAWREDRRGWVASGMRLWKRPAIRAMFGRHGKVIFREEAGQSARVAEARGMRRMVWATRAETRQDGIVRVEDGFLRSRGLGATLTPPLSLVADDLGIHYDPTRPSRLETLIAERAQLRPDQRARAEALIGTLIRTGVTKYNTGGAVPSLPPGHRILVPGQLADDAAVLAGPCGAISDRDVLTATRAAHPEAVLIYKPHPDVIAGLRRGDPAAADLADVVVPGSDPAALLAEVAEVWTCSSTLGFEALIRGLPVTTLGAPFYAGWGLTTDIGHVPARRRHGVSIAGLVHAALIDYPRYHDPETALPCPVEVVVARLATGTVAPRGAFNRLLAKAQGVLASPDPFWRR